MALTGGDALTAFSFEFSVDGTTIPNVVAVNSISKNAPVIETKSMTPDGKYVNQKMYGPNQSGEMSISVLNTGDQAVTGWIMSGLGGDQASGRGSKLLTSGQFPPGSEGPRDAPTLVTGERAPPSPRV